MTQWVVVSFQQSSQHRPWHFDLTVKLKSLLVAAPRFDFLWYLPQAFFTQILIKVVQAVYQLFISLDLVVAANSFKLKFISFKFKTNYFKKYSTCDEFIKWVNSIDADSYCPRVTCPYVCPHHISVLLHKATHY